MTENLSDRFSKHRMNSLSELKADTTLTRTKERAVDVLKQKIAEQPNPYEMVAKNLVNETLNKTTTLPSSTPIKSANMQRSLSPETTFDYNNKLGQDRKNTQQTSDLTDKELNHIGNWYVPRPQVPAIRPQAQEAFSESVDYESPAYYRSLNEPDSSNIQQTMVSHLSDSNNIKAETPSNLHRIEDNQYKLPSGYQPMYNSEDRVQIQAQTFSNLLPTSKNFQSQMHIVNLYASPKAGRRSISSHGSIPIPVIHERKFNHPRYEPYEEIDMFRRFRSKAQSPPPPSSPPFGADERFRGSSLPPLGPADSFRSPNVPNKIEHSSFERRPDQSVAQYFKQEQNRDNVVKATREVITFQNEEDPTQYSTMRATVRGGQNPNNVIPKVYTATITYYHHQSENYPNQGLPKPNAMSTPIPSEQRIVIEPPYDKSIRDKSRIIDSAAFGNIARPVRVQDEKTFVRRIDNKDDSHLYGSSVDSGYGRWGDQSPPLSPFGANSNESRSPLPVTNYYSNVPTRETVIVDRQGPSPTPPIGAVFIPGPPPRVSSPHQEYLLPAVVTEEKKKHGFFSRGDKDKEPVQKVGYIPVIDGAVQLIPAGRDGKPDIHAIDTSKNNGSPQMVPMPGAFIQGPSQPIPRGQIVQEVREYREILPPQPVRHPSPHSHQVPIGFVSVPMQRFDGDRPRYIEERRIPPPSTASGGFDPNAYHGGWERGQGQPVYLKEAPRDYVPSGGVTLIEDRQDKSLHLLPGYDTRETHSTPIGVAHPTWNRDKEVHFRDSQFRDGPPHDQGKRRTSLKDRFKELVGLDHPHHPAHEEKGDYVLTGVFTDDDKKALKHEEIKSKDDGKTITKTTEVTEHKEEVKTTGPSADQRIRAGISDINEYNRGVSDERLRTLKRDAERISRDADSLKLDAKDLRDDIDNKRIFAEWGMSDQPANASTTAVVNTSSTTTTTRARSNSIKGYIHDEVDHIKNRIMHPFGGGHPHAVAAATAVPAPTERRPSISDRVSEKYHHMKDKVEHYVHDHSHSPPRHDTTAAGAVVTEYHPHKKSMSEKISEKFDDMKEKVKEPFTRDDKDRGSYRTESGGVGYYPLPSSQRYYEERPPAVYYEERRYPATQYYPSDRGGASVVPIAVAGGAAGVGASEAMRRHRSPSIKERITEFFKGPSSTTDKNIPAATSQNVPTYVDYGKPQPSGFTSTSYVSSAPQDYYRLQRSPSVKDKIFDATDEKVFHNRFYDPNDPLYRGPSQLQRKRSFKEKIADSVQNAKEKITGPSTTVNYDKPGRAYYSDNVRVPVYSTVGYVSQPEPTFNESDYYRSPIKREIITSEEVLRVPDTVIIDDSVKSRLPDWKKGEAVQAIPITVVERREYIPDRKNDIPYQSNLRIIDDNRDYYGTQRPVETVEIQRIPAQTNYVSDYKPFPPPATLLLGSKPYYGDDISSGNRLGIGDRSRIQITTNDIRPGPHYVARDIGRSVSPPSYYATKSTSFRSKSYDPARFPRFVVVDKRRGGNAPGDSTYGTDFYKEVLAGKFNDPDSAFPNLKYLPRTTSASSFFGSGGHYTTSGGAGQPPPSYYAVEHHDKKKGDSFNIKDWFTGGIFSDKKSSKKPEVEYEVYDPHAQYATQQLVRETQPIAVESSQQPYIIEETSVQNTLTPHVAQHIPVMTVSQTDHLKHASTVSQSSPHIVNYESNLNNIPSANQQIVFKDFSHNESLVPVPTPSKEQIVLYSDLHKPLISSQADSTVKSTGDVSGPSTSSLKEKEKKTSIFGKKPKKLFNKLKDSLSIDRDDKRNVEASKNKAPIIMSTNILPNSSDKVGSTVITSSQSANATTIDAIYDPKTGHYKYHDPLNQPYEKIQDGIFHDALFKENGKELTKHLGPNQVEVIPGTELINKMSTIHPTTLYNNLGENASFVHGDGSVITTNVDPNNFIKPDLMSAKWPKQTEATNGGIYEYKDPIGDPYHKIKDPALQDSVFREQAVKHLSTMSLSTTHADRVYTNQYDTTKTISSLQEPISSYKVKNQKSDSNWAIPRNSADIPPEHYLQQGKDGKPNHDVSTLGKLERDKTSTHFSKIQTIMPSLDNVGKPALFSSSMPLNSAKVLNNESPPITTFNTHYHRPIDSKVSKDTSQTIISSSHSNKLDATPHPASYKLVPHVKIPENSADIPDHSYDNRIPVKEESIKKSVFIPCPCNGPPHPHSAHEHEVSDENQINISKNSTDDDTKAKQPFKPLPSGGIYLPAEKSMQRKNERDFSNYADINDKWPKTISVLPGDEIKDEYSTPNKRQPNNIERVCQSSPINYNNSTLTSKGNNIQSQGQAISSVNYEKEIPLQNTMDDYEINTGHFNARNSLIVTCAQNSIDTYDNTTIAHTPSDQNNYKSNIVNSIENDEPKSSTKLKPFSGIKNFFGGVGIKREKSPKNMPLANESSPLTNVNKFTRSEVDSPSEISQIVSNTDKLKLLTDNVINRNDMQTDSIKHYPVTYVKDEVKWLPRETLVDKNIKDVGMSDIKKSKKKPSITKLFSFKSDKSDKNKNSISNANNVIPYTEPKITETTLIEDKTLSSSHDFDKNLLKYILSPPQSAIDKPIFVQDHQTDNNKMEMKDGSNFENNLMQYIFRDKDDSHSIYNIDNNSRCERLSTSNIGLLLNYITTPTSSDETGGDMTKYSPSVKNELLKYVLTSATDDDKLNASDNQSKTKTNNNLLNMTIIHTNYNTSTHHTIDTYISAPSSNNHNKQTKKFGDQLQAFLFGTANSTSTKSTMDDNSEHNNNTSYPNLESSPYNNNPITVSPQSSNRNITQIQTNAVGNLRTFNTAIVQPNDSPIPHFENKGEALIFTHHKTDTGYETDGEEFVRSATQQGKRNLENMSSSDSHQNNVHTSPEEPTTSARNGDQVEEKHKADKKGFWLFDYLSLTPTSDTLHPNTSSSLLSNSNILTNSQNLNEDNIVPRKDINLKRTPTDIKSTKLESQQGRIKNSRYLHKNATGNDGDGYLSDSQTYNLKSEDHYGREMKLIERIVMQNKLKLILLCLAFIIFLSIYFTSQDLIL